MEHWDSLARMAAAQTLIIVGLILGSCSVQAAPAALKPAPVLPAARELSVPLTDLKPARGAASAPLAAFAGWQVPGIGQIPVALTSQEATFFAGAMPILQTPNQTAIQVVGFRLPQLRQFTVAVLFPAHFSLAALVPALRTTPLADLTFEQGIFFLVPPGTGAGETVLPPQLAKILGKNTLRLAEGSNFFSLPVIAGRVRELLSQYGLPYVNPPLSGKFDPSVLAARVGTAPLTQSFLQALDLSVPLGNLRANWLAGFLAFNNATLNIKGENNDIVASITANIAVDLGAGKSLVFPGAKLTRDMKTGVLTLSGGPIKPPAGMLALPANIAALDSLSFVGTIDGNNKAFTLNGVGTIDQKPESFTLTLSGTGTQADYAFSLGGTQSLADFLGWRIPGLEDIKVSNVTLGGGGPGGKDSAGDPGYSGGRFQFNIPRLGNIPANLFAFKPSVPGVPATGGGASAGGGAASGGSTSTLGAITLPSLAALELPDLIPKLKGSPLDGLKIGNPGFILAPSGFSYSALRLPGPVFTQSGSASTQGGSSAVQSSSAARTTEAKGGLNLRGAIDLPTTGSLHELIAGARLGNLLSKGLPLTGSIDPRLLKGGAIGTQIADALLASLDIEIPLGNVKPAWMEGYLAFDNARLSIKNVKGDIVASIVADVTVDIGAGKKLVFAQTELTRDMKTGVLTLSGGPIKPPMGMLALPANIAALDSLSFIGTIDGNNKAFTLTGAGTVDKKPETFTVTLSGTGLHADYAFSLGGTQSLADLLGWQSPGLEDIKVSNISLGSGSAASGASPGSPSYTGGTIQIGAIAANLFVFKPGKPGVQSAGGSSSSAGAKGGNSPSLAAITFPKLHLPDLIPQLKGSPLDGMQISNPGFILAPSGLSFDALTLPGPVATHTGSTNTDIKGGLNLRGRAMPAGKMADLLNAAGLSHLLSGGLPLTGGIDPRLLKAGGIAGDIAQAIISSIDISAPLGPLALPGVPALLSAKSSTLTIKGKTNGVDIGLAAPITLTAGRHGYTFDAFITVDRQNGATETTISGSYPAASEQPKGAANEIKSAFGISWLTLEKVSLAVTLGAKKSISVGGTTSLGKIKDLTAAVFIDAQGSQVTDFGVSLTGADIGLAELPGFASLKQLPDIRFRDLLVSETEVAGTLKTSNSMFNNLRAVIFRTGNQLTLAAVREKFTLEDIIPLPGPAKPLFSSIRFDKGLLIVSEGGVQGQISSLPQAAAALLTEVYGDAGRRLKLGNGFNVAIALDPSAMGKGLSQLGMSKGKYVLDGGLEGVFGGTPSFMLSVVIPPVNFPRTLNFLNPPRNMQTAFFTKLTEADASLGVSVSGDFAMKTKHGTVVFTNAIAFEADAQGGLAIDLSGTSDTTWPNPMGIPGMTLNPGTMLDLKVSATSEVDLTFIGKSTIGKKEIDLTGSAGILVAEGVIDKGAFEGKLSEIGLEDIVALSNAATAAAGGKPPATKFPTAKLTNVDFAFASPGAVVQGMNLSGGGTRVAGDLWLIMKHAPLGKFLAQVDGNGIIASGDISDFKLGPVKLEGNKLEARATLMPPAPPYLKVKGGAELFAAKGKKGKKQDVELVLSLEEMELVADIDLGDLLKFDFRANAELPVNGFDAKELENSDLSLDVLLRSDIPAWLRGPGRKVVSKSFDSVRDGLKKFTDDLNAAQKAVTYLDGMIAKAREQVKHDMQTNEQKLKSAEDHVNQLQSTLDRLDKLADEANPKNKCDGYKVRKCVQSKWFKCTKWKEVPDDIKIAACYVSQGSKWAEAKGAVSAARLAKDQAAAFLNDLRKGEKFAGDNQAAIDADPRVASLLLDQKSAEAALKVAKLAAQGALKANDAIEKALDGFARSDAFVLKEGRINGSLKKSLEGKPILLKLDFAALGKDYDMELVFSITDPVFDAEQLGTLGLFIASKLLAEKHSNDPSMKAFIGLVHDTYIASYDAEEAKLKQVKKENGLE